MVAKTARFLAPLALAAVGVGVYLIVHSTLDKHSPTVSTSSSIATGRKHTTHRHRRSSKFYVVKSGDTLSKISIHVHVPVAELTSLNPSLSSDPNSLQTGQRLRLRR